MDKFKLINKLNNCFTFVLMDTKFSKMKFRMRLEINLSNRMACVDQYKNRYENRYERLDIHNYIENVEIYIGTYILNFSGNELVRIRQGDFIDLSDKLYCDLDFMIETFYDMQQFKNINNMNVKVNIKPSFIDVLGHNPIVHRIDTLGILCEEYNENVDEIDKDQQISRISNEYTIKKRVTFKQEIFFIPRGRCNILFYYHLSKLVVDGLISISYEKGNGLSTLSNETKDMNKYIIDNQALKFDMYMYNNSDEERTLKPYVELEYIYKQRF